MLLTAQRRLPDVEKIVQLIERSVNIDTDGSTWVDGGDEVPNDGIGNRRLRSSTQRTLNSIGGSNP